MLIRRAGCIQQTSHLTPVAIGNADRTSDQQREHLTESNVKTLAILSQLLLLGLGTFLMIVILLQRGRGGGLAGAFGGLGGQSAFGTKAGDVFTKITIVLAVAWVIVAGGSGYFLQAGAEERASGLGDTEPGISADELGDEDPDFGPLPDPPQAPQGDAADMDADTQPGPQTDAGASGTPAADQDAAPGDAAPADDAAAAPRSESPADTPESPEQQ
jgi:preprotein translocase subunit SecG